MFNFLVAYCAKGKITTNSCIILIIIIINYAHNLILYLLILFLSSAYKPGDFGLVPNGKRESVGGRRGVRPPLPPVTRTDLPPLQTVSTSNRD